MRAKAATVVGAEEDDGLFFEVFGGEGIEDAAELLIDPGDGGKVIGHRRAEVAAHRGVCRGVIALGERFGGLPTEARAVLLRDEFVAGVGRVHRDDEGEGAPGGLEEVDRAIGLVFWAPLVNEVEALARGVAIPVHRLEVPIVGAIGVPVVEAVSARWGAPLVPLEFAIIIIGGDPGRMGGVKVPLANVGEVVAGACKEVGPASDVGTQFRPAALVGGGAVGPDAADLGHGAGEEDGTEGAADGVVADGLREGVGLARKGIEARGLGAVEPHKAEGVRAHLVGKDDEEVRPLGLGGADGAGTGTGEAKAKEA